MRHVRVEWEGPFSIEQVVGLRGANDGTGLYQIYGRHMVLGPNCLLYIGRADTTFGDRIRSHCDQWLLRKGTPRYQEWEAVSIRIGRLFYARDTGFFAKQVDKTVSEVLQDVEAFEIFCHCPPYNGSNIDSYTGQPLTVVNIAERGDLLPRLTTAEFTHTDVSRECDGKYD